MENSLAYAQTQDKNDALASFIDKFYHPVINGKQALYFTGNSLGLQPKSAEAFLKEELDAWRKLGVEGHFEAKRPWFSYHEFFSKGLAYVTGAKETEVVAMGSLTANLHSLMVSFYRPTSARYKILCEKKAFPSDTYALQSQAKLHGYEI